LNLKLEAIKRFGGRCACCGETRYQFLSFDHVDGDGAQHRREAGGFWPARSSSFLRYLKKNDWKSKYRIRVLCMNCHIAEDLWGACPHRLERCAASQERVALYESEGFEVVAE